MIEDDELEAILRRYRISDPPRGFIDRMGDAAREPASCRICAPALAAAVLLAWAAVHTSMAEPARDAERDAEVALIAEVLGGDEDAIRYAEFVVPRSEPDPAGPFEVPGEPPW